MPPDGISSSSEVVLENQAPSPMQTASTGTSSETPALPGPRATRALGRGRGRDSQATSGGNAFPTTERPSRAKKNYRPAQVMFDYSIQRRTSEQVKASQAKAKTEAAAADAAAAAHQQSQKDRIAALEDAMQAEELTRSLEGIRPDLHINHKSATNTNDDTLSDSHLNHEDPVDIPDEPVMDLPSDRSSYRDSSQSEEYLTGWGREEIAGENGEENDQGQDYVMPSDNESEASQACLRTKAKFKPQRGHFRAAVNEARQVPPPSQLKKRKGPDPSPPVDGHATKRTKTSDPGGLVPNWKKSVDILSHIANKHPIEFVDDEDHVSVEGEFDRAEGSGTLGAACESTYPKFPTVKIDKMLYGVKFSPKPLYRTINNTRRQGKVMVDDLPFPHPRTSYNAKWQKVFRPTLLSWASTWPDPYATNTQLDELVVLEMWDIIYPDIELDKEDRMATGVKLVHLAGNILHDWRSTIGTGALNVVRSHFLLPTNRFHKERIAKFVKWGLDPKKFNFIYGDPYADANEKQSFRSELILNVYAIHLRKVAGAAATYGEQYGALALCTAATERALGFWSSGEDMSMKMDENGKRRLAAPFGETEWGSKARAWSQTTSRLNMDQWRLISTEATIRGKKLPQDEANGEDATDADPRAVLEL